MFRGTTIAVALVCLPSLAWAGDKPLYRPAPAWVKSAPALDMSKLSDADPILLVVDSQQRFENGQLWAYSEMAMRISSPQVATQAGTVPLPWNPDKGDLIVHHVQIIRGSERIDALGGGKNVAVLRREQQLERATLDGMLTATLPVEGLRVGDVMRVAFSVTHKNAALGGHVQTVGSLVPGPLRLQFGRTRLMWPKGLDLKWRDYSNIPNLKPVETPDGFNELLIPMPIAKPAEMPADAPLRFRQLPLLDATDYASWADISRGMAAHYRTQGTIAPGSPIAAEVARIAAATSDPRQRAAMALQAVQDKVRYLFKGMDSGDYVPQAPAQTWESRYGDCKAKALLLTAMLRELKIDAEPALVNTELGDLVFQRLPIPAAFDHVIVRATIGGETLWLDGTGGGSRLEDLSDVPPFRHALPLREEGAELVAIPMKPNARPITDAEIELDARAGVLFPTPYSVRMAVRGAQAEMLRAIAAQAGKDELDEAVDAITSELLGTSETIERSFQYDEAGATALLKASGITYPDWSKERGRYRSKLDRAVVNVAFSPDRARPAWRDIPVSSGAYQDIRVRSRIRLPGGGAGFELEGDQVLPAMLAGTALQRKVMLDSGMLTIEDRVTKGVGEVAPADIAATRAQVNQARGRLLKVVAPKDYQPLFRQIETAKAAKSLNPILDVYARRIAAKPQEADGYADRAWFLDRIYDRKGAVADLSKAIALEPTVERHLWRSRLYSALMDDTRAMVDARAAMEIDPGSVAAVQRVAYLSGELGKHDEALTLLSERADAGGDDRNAYVTSQASLLARVGKHEEGIALLDEIIVATPGKPDLLNERCWMKATGNIALDSAVRDCSKSIELSEAPANVLDSRGFAYFRMGRTDDALADFDAALEEVPDLAGSLYMRGVIRKRTGAAGADIDLAAARMISPRIDEEYARYGIKP